MSRKRFGYRGHWEHRNAIRFKSQTEVYCFVSSSSSYDSWPGWIFNLSTSGIAVLLEVNFAAGSIIDIQLENQHHDLVRRVKAEVKHSAIRFPNDTWLHGCVFLEPISADDLSALATVNTGETMQKSTSDSAESFD